MRNSDIYKKSIRETRPIKRFWWSLEEKSPEEIVLMHMEYLRKRREKFVGGANKRHSDPEYSKASKENMRRIRKMSIPKPMSEDTRKKVSESIKGRKWYTNLETGEHIQRKDPPLEKKWAPGRLRIFRR